MKNKPFAPKARASRTIRAISASVDESSTLKAPEARLISPARALEANPLIVVECEGADTRGPGASSEAEGPERLDCDRLGS